MLLVLSGLSVWKHRANDAPAEQSTAEHLMLDDCESIRVRINVTRMTISHRHVWPCVFVYL